MVNKIIRNIIIHAIGFGVIFMACAAEYIADVVTAWF